MNPRKNSPPLARQLNVLVKPILYCAVALFAACTTTGFEGREAPMLEEPVFAVEAAPMAGDMMPAPLMPPVAKVISTRSRATRSPRQDVITAGDIDDSLNVDSFQRYAAKAARDTKLAHSNFTRPVLLQLIGADRLPAPGVPVTLRRPGAADPFYTGTSGVDGHITVFPALLGAGWLSTVELRAFPLGHGQVVTRKISTSSSRKQVNLPFAGYWSPEFLDLAFVVDTTGSMADELAWLTRELNGIVRAARRSAPGISIRYGLIVYRDQGDEYVVRNYGFTKQMSQMQGWLRQQNASGGGDYPEAAAKALAAGAALDWRRGNGERLMFHIADAPPHDRDARAYLAAAKKAAQNNVQIFGLGASGVAAKSEFMMRQAALQTGGRYLFLTDDSGVGAGHAEPTIACYRVTKLKNLMVRVLRSELAGRRIEAPANKVIRSVGAYRAGVCRS